MGNLFSFNYVHTSMISINWLTKYKQYFRDSDEMKVSFMMTLVPGSKYLLYLKIKAYANKLLNPCARVLANTFGISISVRLRKK